ncbi:MAG TPA: hypothetical protein VHT73_11940 [Thermodesulfobacteriota bacterium]|nr:hypothetical protein [Thermodesulfobacteriota bacterium]
MEETKFAKYREIRDNIIRPALKELKKEYESQGYHCHIHTQETQGAISFSRGLSNYDEDPVSIFLSDGGWVIFSKLTALYSSRLKLDEITPDRVKGKIREALDE